MVTTREELAWAAGFFDGEGCTSRGEARRSPRGYGGVQRPYLSITQYHNPECLHRFKKAVRGLGKVYGPYKGNGGKGIKYQYATTSWAECQAAIAMLWTFLSHPKREQAKKLLGEYTKQPSYPPGTAPQELCRNGHADWYVQKNGRRYCRSCRNAVRKRPENKVKAAAYAVKYRARKTELQKQRRQETGVKA